MGITEVQRLIGDMVKLQNALSIYGLTELEKNCLLIKPCPFHPDDIVDPNKNPFGHTLSLYHNFVEEEKKKAKEERERKV